MSDTDPITNTKDVIDSRDVIARIAYLRASWAEATGDDPDTYDLSGDDLRSGLDDDEADELVALMALADEASGYADDWEYGETLIRDDYFEQYAQELAYDVAPTRELGELIRNDGAGEHWPFTAASIDWELATEQLQEDYTAVDFDGVTYWVR